MNDLHALMDRALADVDVPTERLHDGAVRRGRAARRRRRAGIALGGVATAVAVATLALPSLGGSGPHEGSVAHEGPVLPHPDAYEPAPGWWNMSGTEMSHRLGFLLPDGLSTTLTMTGVHGGSLQVDVADALGPAGGVNVLLYAPQPDTAAGRAFVRGHTTCPGNADVAPDWCTQVRDASGDAVGRLVKWDTGGVIVLEATHVTPDGALVYAAASNSSDVKWGSGSSVDRDAPPVTLAQLREIAESRSWQQDWSGTE